MSWFSDAKGEWDKLPGGGKVAVAGIALLVIGVGGYEYYKSTQAGATASQQAGVPPNPATQGIGGLSALDTSSLANMIAGLVNTQGQVGATGAPGPAGTPPPTPAFTWPSALNGMQIWQGTQTHNFWFGPKGPQQDQVGQTLLSSLFPTGTIFTTQGSKLFYQLPGSTTPVASNITLVNPTPPPEVHHGGPPLPSTRLTLT